LWGESESSSDVMEQSQEPGKHSLLDIVPATTLIAVHHSADLMNYLQDQKWHYSPPLAKKIDLISHRRIHLDCPMFKYPSNNQSTPVPLSLSSGKYSDFKAYEQASSTSYRPLPQLSVTKRSSSLMDDYCNAQLCFQDIPFF